MESSPSHKLPPNHSVQVLNIEYKSPSTRPTIKDFKKSFKLWKKLTAPLLLHDSVSVEIVSLTHEENFCVNAQTKRLEPVSECFLQFASEKDVQMVLGFAQGLDLYESCTARYCPVNFALPLRSAATRTGLRRIGNLLERLRETEAEIETLGTVKYGDPILHSHFQEREEYAKRLVQIKGERAAGTSCDMDTYHDLRTMKPVDLAAMQGRLQRLYDAKCDVLIELREIQCCGDDVEALVIDFDFDASL